ncbi:hypothetical protein [Neomesorhizobium albiziae]|uniref:hypothetical protein n=1 Tax=Neomesorhizobium albiziae TaxID=335020 RepID=UPI001FCE8154|nr:hypothetical protein [Mesorhizobium albiziae]
MSRRRSWRDFAQPDMRRRRHRRQQHRRNPTKSLSLDGKHFENCLFDRCRRDYAGDIPPTLTGCSFENCEFSFSGKAAYTLAFLSGMHSGGFSAIVEETFQKVRDGAYINVPVQNTGPRATLPPADAHPLSFRVPRIVKIPK